VSGAGTWFSSSPRTLATDCQDPGDALELIFAFYFVGRCLVLENANAARRSDTAWKAGRDVWWHDVVLKQSKDASVEWMDSEDPLFMLYTSGSTGKPKVNPRAFLANVSGWKFGFAYNCRLASLTAGSRTECQAALLP
jgi:acyl-coenzyme A synthetase/AMP-(fatty) acid ligase